MHVDLIRNLFFSVKNEPKRFMGRGRSSGRKANLESQSILITHGRGALVLTPHFTRSGRILSMKLPPSYKPDRIIICTRRRRTSIKRLLALKIYSLTFCINSLSLSRYCTNNCGMTRPILSCKLMNIGNLATNETVVLGMLPFNQFCP